MCGITTFSLASDHTSVTSCCELSRTLGRPPLSSPPEATFPSPPEPHAPPRARAASIRARLRRCLALSGASSGAVTAEDAGAATAVRSAVVSTPSPPSHAAAWSDNRRRSVWCAPSSTTCAGSQYCQVAARLNGSFSRARAPATHLWRTKLGQTPQSVNHGSQITVPSVLAIVRDLHCQRVHERRTSGPHLEVRRVQPGMGVEVRGRE